MGGRKITSKIKSTLNMNGFVPYRLCEIKIIGTYNNTRLSTYKF
jgi:hypothetical protein